MLRNYHGQTIVVHVIHACVKVLSLPLPRLPLFSHMDKIMNWKGFFMHATMLIIRNDAAEIELYQFQTITHYLIMMVIFIRRVMQYTISIFLFRCGVYRCISLCFFFKIISMLFSTICRSIHTVSYYLHLILYCKLHEQLCHVIFCFFLCLSS